MERKVWREGSEDHSLGRGSDHGGLSLSEEVYDEGLKGNRFQPLECIIIYLHSGSSYWLAGLTNPRLLLGLPAHYLSFLLRRTLHKNERPGKKKTIESVRSGFSDFFISFMAYLSSSLPPFYYPISFFVRFDYGAPF